jgi:hypothetical protein
MPETQLIAWVTAGAAAEQATRPPTASKRHLRMRGAARTLCGSEIPTSERVRMRVSLAAVACKRCERIQARRDG